MHPSLSLPIPIPLPLLFLLPISPSLGLSLSPPSLLLSLPLPPYSHLSYSIFVSYSLSLFSRYLPPTHTLSPLFIGLSLPPSLPWSTFLPLHIYLITHPSLSFPLSLSHLSPPSRSLTSIPPFLYTLIFPFLPPSLLTLTSLILSICIFFLLSPLLELPPWLGLRV